MCGYCTEGMMIQELVNARLTRSQINMDDLFLPQYLQGYGNFESL
jgi:aerobic-type carbon monoxide dehydrogenase small subunit (CoxS/CutS family)